GVRRSSYAEAESMARPMSGQRSESVTTDRSGKPKTGPKVGLVLGGGGILGGAWLVGALYALTEAAGWDPATADYVVGTSAASVVGSLVASGIPPWFLVHHQRGGDVSGMFDAQGE